MKIKKSLIVILASLLALIAVGCSGRSNDGRTVLRVNIFAAGFGDTWLKETEKAFEELHPDVNVVVSSDVDMDTQVKNKLEAGEYAKAGDIFSFINQSVFEEMVREGHVADLTEFYGTTVDNKGANGAARTMNDLVDPGFMSFVTINQKYYGVPWEGAVTGFAYNAGMFKEYGWEVPDTMAEFYALCDKIIDDTNGTVAPLVYPGVAHTYWTNPMMEWMASWEGEEGTKEFFALESPAVFQKEGRLKAYEELAKVLDRSDILYQGYKGLSHLDAQTVFIDGEAAMVVTGNWINNEMKAVLEELPAFEMGMFVAPTLSDVDKNGNPAKKYNSGNCDMLCINEHSANKDLAYEFMRFMHTQEMLEVYVRETGGNPRPFHFDRTDWSSFGTWTASLMEAWQTSINIFPYSSADIFRAGEIGFWPGNSGLPTDKIQNASNYLIAARECFASDYTDAVKMFERYDANN